MPRCSVIVVTYNSADSITACLEALAAEDCEIVVVDNASTDNTVPGVKAFQARHAVDLLLISRNLGFAAAVNHGVRAASTSVVVILNPDAIAEPGAIAALLGCMTKQSADATGGALLQSDGEPQKGFVFRRFPSLGSLLAEVLLVNQLWPRNPSNRRYRCLDADYERVQEVEQPAGACLAVTREAWDKVGGMDTQFYPVWFEDVDFCKRLREAGLTIIYCPAARFRHAGAHSVGKLGFAQKQIFWYTNMLRYASKHLSPGRVFVLRIAIGIGMILRYMATMAGARPNGVSGSEARKAYINVLRISLSPKLFSS
jgi:GT2 family glycosyltransferase